MSSKRLKQAWGVLLGGSAGQTIDDMRQVRPCLPIDSEAGPLIDVSVRPGSNPLPPDGARPAPPPNPPQAYMYFADSAGTPISPADFAYMAVNIACGRLHEKLKEHGIDGMLIAGARQDCNDGSTEEILRRIRWTR